MADFPQAPRGRTGKMSGLGFLLMLAEVGGTVGACLAVHLWMAP